MLKAFPAESALNLIAFNDCVPFFSTMTGWAREVTEAVRRRPDLELLCEDDFTGTNEDQLREVTAGYPMPLRVWKKMRLYAQEGADGVIQHHVGGPTFGANSINDLAWRIFSWHPFMERVEAEEVVRRMLHAQLGSAEAANLMFQACEAVELCLDADEEGASDRPYIARFGHAHKFFAQPLLLSSIEQLREDLDEYFASGREGRPAIWLETLRKEAAALEEAVGYSRRAVLAAPVENGRLLRIAGPMPRGWPMPSGSCAASKKRCAIESRFRL
jgi:hypothetical protein